LGRVLNVDKCVKCGETGGELREMKYSEEPDSEIIVLKHCPNCFPVVKGNMYNMSIHLGE
jgi:hypothetical protein